MQWCDDYSTVRLGFQRKHRVRVNYYAFEIFAINHLTASSGKPVFFRQNWSQCLSKVGVYPTDQGPTRAKREARLTVFAHVDNEARRAPNAQRCHTPQTVLYTG